MASRHRSLAVPVHFYAYALGLPVLIMAAMNAVLAALGQQPDVSLLFGRIPAYLQTLLVTAVIFGGQEEPGWRGFAYPLEQRYATSGDADLGFRLGSVAHPAIRSGRVRGASGARLLLQLAVQPDAWRLLCILLHASFTAAQDHLLLSADSRIVDAVLLGTYVVRAGVLVAVTRGRLGMPTKEADDR